MSLRKFFLFSVLFSVILAGCGYMWQDVEQGQVAAEFDYNSLSDCFPPGFYSAFMDFGKELKLYSTAAISFDVNDDSVATYDNQEVGVNVTIQAQRMGLLPVTENNPDKCSAVRNFYANYPHLLDDQTLIDLMSRTALEGIKVGVRSMNIYQLLDDRNKLSDTVLTAIQEDANQYSVLVLDVTVNSVNPTDEFMAILNETANITAETNKELRRQDLISQIAANEVLSRTQAIKVAEEQLRLEQANTEVELEIANRQGEMVAAQYQVYEENERAFEIRMAEIQRDMLNSKAQFWFVPNDTNLNLFPGAVPTVVPVNTGE